VTLVSPGATLEPPQPLDAVGPPRVVAVAAAAPPLPATTAAAVTKTVTHRSLMS
jgi:hypothetical protein